MENSKEVLVKQLIQTIVDDFRGNRLKKLSWSKKTEYVIKHYHDQLYYLGMIQTASIPNTLERTITWHDDRLADFFGDLFVQCLFNHCN